MDINFVQIFFYTMFLLTVALGAALIVMTVFLPSFTSMYKKYEKYTYFVSQYPCMSNFFVPEEWLKHVYKFPIIVSSFVLVLTFNRYLYHTELPESVYWILDKLFGDNRQALVSPESTLLAIFLLTVHCAQRFYDLHFVSSFDPNEMIDATNVVFTCLHYGAAVATVIGESGGFVRNSIIDFQWSRLAYMQYLCAIILLLSSYQQLKARTFRETLPAEKRACKPSCDVVTPPYGEIVEYLSGFTELTESIVYFMLATIMMGSSTFYCILFWIVANEITMSTLSHIYHRKWCFKPHVM